jgi:hypothetical protein
MSHFDFNFVNSWSIVSCVDIAVKYHQFILLILSSRIGIVIECISANVYVYVYTWIWENTPTENRKHVLRRTRFLLSSMSSPVLYVCIYGKIQIQQMGSIYASDTICFKFNVAIIFFPSNAPLPCRLLQSIQAFLTF